MSDRTVSEMMIGLLDKNASVTVQYVEEHLNEGNRAVSPLLTHTGHVLHYY